MKTIRRLLRRFATTRFTTNWDPFNAPQRPYR